MDNKYQYYANRVFDQAMIDPEVDAFDMAEVVAYSEEIAELLVLDETKLRNEVERMAEIHEMSSF